MISETSQVLSSIDLTPIFHQVAESLSAHHADPVKAEQVYLNTLAVFAVNKYLQSCGFKTDIQTGYRQNPVMQMFMDVADLLVIGRGRLECRPVMPYSDHVHFPIEVLTDRIGFVVVQLDASLSEATLLGFVKKVSIEDLPINQLRTIEYFSAYLHSLNPTIHLSDWFKDKTDSGWQDADKLIDYSFPKEITSFIRDHAPELNPIRLQYSTAKKAKLIPLGDYIAVLQIYIVTLINHHMKVYITLQPTNNQIDLVPNIRLAVLSETKEIMSEAYSYPNVPLGEYIAGNIGKRFSVEVTLDDYSFTENFLI